MDTRNNESGESGKLETTNESEMEIHNRPISVYARTIFTGSNNINRLFNCRMLLLSCGSVSGAVLCFRSTSGLPAYCCSVALVSRVTLDLVKKPSKPS